jgi:hypothetical protein
VSDHWREKGERGGEEEGGGGSSERRWFDETKQEVSTLMASMRVIISPVIISKVFIMWPF